MNLRGTAITASINPLQPHNCHFSSMHALAFTFLNAVLFLKKNICIGAIEDAGICTCLRTFSRAESSQLGVLDFSGLIDKAELGVVWIAIVKRDR